MTDNVRKIFDMLGVEPNEKFKIKGLSDTFYIDDALMLFVVETNQTWLNTLRYLLNGTYEIIKLPKKKKLRDLTVEEYKKWQIKNCDNRSDCENCIFHKVACVHTRKTCWIYNKDLYSYKFLDQEVEVE